jgi:iron-sulfur cluster insertion protein
MEAAAQIKDALGGSPVQDSFNITEAARGKLAELVNNGKQDNPEIKGVRIYVAGSSCSGVQWGMTFADSAESSDTVISAAGLDVFVDPQCLSTLDGVHIEFEDGDNGGAFRFVNTKASSGGGCGTCGSSSGGGCG